MRPSIRLSSGPLQCSWRSCGSYRFGPDQDLSDVSKSNTNFHAKCPTSASLQGTIKKYRHRRTRPFGSLAQYGESFPFPTLLIVQTLAQRCTDGMELVVNLANVAAAVLLTPASTTRRLAHSLNQHGNIGLIAKGLGWVAFLVTNMMCIRLSACLCARSPSLACSHDGCSNRLSLNRIAILSSISGPVFTDTSVY